jgi:hypothetical protein
MNIALSPDGALALTLPSGRVLSIPITPATGTFLAKLLYDAEHQTAPLRGYIGSYPTQAITDAWLRQAAEVRQSTALEELGVDIEELEIKL